MTTHTAMARALLSAKNAGTLRLKRIDAPEPETSGSLRSTFNDQVDASRSFDYGDIDRGAQDDKDRDPEPQAEPPARDLASLFKQANVLKSDALAIEIVDKALERLCEKDNSYRPFWNDGPDKAVVRLLMQYKNGGTAAPLAAYRSDAQWKLGRILEQASWLVYRQCYGMASEGQDAQQQVGSFLDDLSAGYDLGPQPLQEGTVCQDDDAHHNSSTGLSDSANYGAHPDPDAGRLVDGDASTFETAGRRTLLATLDDIAYYFNVCLTMMFMSANQRPPDYGLCVYSAPKAGGTQGYDRTYSVEDGYDLYCRSQDEWKARQTEQRRAITREHEQQAIRDLRASKPRLDAKSEARDAFMDRLYTRPDRLNRAQ